MARPRFGEILAQRRRQLGLSTQQASNILKLREDVLIAFEEGDFERMPQSGYAQGMLSSYARYLGLNPREITDYFQEELFQYVNGTASHELRRRTRDMRDGRGVGGYDLVNEERSRPKAYVEYHGLLPTAGGPAGDMGNFATTTPTRSRSTGRPVELAGVGPSAAESYRTPNTLYSRERSYNSESRARRAQEQDNRSDAARRRGYAQRRRADVNDPAGRLLRQSQQRPNQDVYDEYHNGGGTARTARTYRRDDVSTRRVTSGEYVDDMRYDEQARPYERASTISGRRGSRNIANTERPNVRRRETTRGGGYSTSSRSRGRSQGNGGIVGGIADFLSDPRRATFLIVLVVAVILTGILVFSVSSCVNGKNTSSSDSTKTVQVNNAQSSSASSDSSTDASTSKTESKSDESTATSSAATSATSGDTAADATADGQAAETTEVKQTVVKVSVADGEYTWLEITCDGKSEVAEGVSGPWEATYTVTSSITVEAGKPDYVTVTNNGEKVEFTSKVSGRGSLTIKGTPVTTDETSADGTTAAGETDTTSETE